MDFLMIVTVIPMALDPVRIGDTQEEEDIIEKEVEDLLIEKITKVEVIQEKEDPLIMEDPLMMEDLQEMEVCLEDKDHQAHQDLLALCAL